MSEQNLQDQLQEAYVAYLKWRQRRLDGEEMEESEFKLPSGIPTEIQAFQFGTPNAAGDVLTRQAVERMVKQLEFRYPIFKARFEDDPQDSSKGTVILNIIPPDDFAIPVLLVNA